MLTSLVPPTIVAAFLHGMPPFETVVLARPNVLVVDLGLDLTTPAVDR